MVTDPSATSESVTSVRRAARLVLAGLGVFVVSLTLSALSYPGGSWADPRAEGFDVLHNYWCDLFRVEAVDGSPSPTAPTLARLAFLTMAATLPVFWWLASRGVGRGRRAAVLAFGSACAASVVVVALLPYGTYPAAHAVATTLAGGLGLGAGGLVLVEQGLFARPRSPVRLWGLALLVCAGANVAIYVPLVLSGGDSATLPVVQKLGTVAVLGWMGTVARDSLSG